MNVRVARPFVLGVDLDGVCADFYGSMREIAAEWLGRDEAELPHDVGYGLEEWGIDQREYRKLHRFAVTQRSLFRRMRPMVGAGPALRRLSAQGVRIRIITHRLYIEYFHQTSVAQTVEWLDNHGIPYWDLCFMREKGAVGADLYVDDAPVNIDALRAEGKDVIIFSNSTNRHLPSAPDYRADTWEDLEALVLKRYEHHRRDAQAMLSAPELPLSG
ncbi:MAG: 5' nucleotidase, NT5C type [Candidatus Dormibacteria bacterium]